VLSGRFTSRYVVRLRRFTRKQFKARIAMLVDRFFFFRIQKCFSLQVQRLADVVLEKARTAGPSSARAD